MNGRIESAVQEAIKEEVDRQLFAIRFNLSNLVGGLLYSLKLEMEKQGGIADIDGLVGIVVNTSRYKGPEGEEYPAWDEDDKRAREIVGRLVKALQAHGIEQSWNIGRSEHLKAEWAKEERREAGK